MKNLQITSPNVSLRNVEYKRNLKFLPNGTPIKIKQSSLGRLLEITENGFLIDVQRKIICDPAAFELIIQVELEFDIENRNEYEFDEFSTLVSNFAENNKEKFEETFNIEAHVNLLIAQITSTFGFTPLFPPDLNQTNIPSNE